MTDELDNADLNSKLRWLLEGDDGSVASKPERLVNAVDGDEWIWSNRHGEPWQSALEAHVANYREPAPDYDWRELALDLIPEHCGLVTQIFGGMKSYVVGCSQKDEIRVSRNDPQLAEKVKWWCLKQLEAHLQPESPPSQGRN